MNWYQTTLLLLMGIYVGVVLVWITLGNSTSTIQKEYLGLAILYTLQHGPVSEKVLANHLPRYLVQGTTFTAQTITSQLDGAVTSLLEKEFIIRTEGGLILTDTGRTLIAKL